MLTREQARVFYALRDAMRTDLRVMYDDVERLAIAAETETDIQDDIIDMQAALLRVSGNLHELLQHIEQEFAGTT